MEPVSTIIVSVLISAMLLGGYAFFVAPQQNVSLAPLPEIEVFEGAGLSDASIRQSLNRIDKGIVDRDAKTLLGYTWTSGVPEFNATSATFDTIFSRLHVNEYRLDLNVLGDANISGSFAVGGDANVSGDLNVYGDSNFQSVGLARNLYGASTGSSFFNVDTMQCNTCPTVGLNSVALGDTSTAVGNGGAFAMGSYNTADGMASFAMGYNVHAYAAGSSVIGQNLYSVNPNTLVVYDLNVANDANVYGDLNVWGDLVAGDLNVSGDLNVLGDANFSTLGVSGGLYVAGDITFDGDLNVTGDLNVFGVILGTDSNFVNVGVSNNVYVGDSIYTANFLSGAYLVSRFVGDIDMRADPWELIGTSLGIADNLRIDDDLNVLGNTQLRGDLNVWGDVNIAGDIDLQGVQFSQGGIKATGDSNFVNVGVSGDAFVGDLYGTGDINFKVGDYRFTWKNTAGQVESGYKPLASGTNAVSMGYQNTATGNYSTAFGFKNTANGQSGFATGQVTTASGSNSAAFGSNTTASGNDSAAFGGNTTASGIGSFATGIVLSSDGRIEALGIGSFVWGVDYGDYLPPSILAVGDGSMAGGYRNTGHIESNKAGSIALGYSDLNHFAGGKGSIALGYDVQALGEATVSLGKNIICDGANMVCVNDLNAKGDLNIGGDLNVMQQAILSNDLNVFGNAQFRKDLNVWGDLNVGGEIDLQGVTFAGGGIIAGDSNFTSIEITSGLYGNKGYFSSDLNIIGNTQIRKDLNVWGDANFAKNMRVYDNAVVDGNLTANKVNVLSNPTDGFIINPSGSENIIDSINNSFWFRTLRSTDDIVFYTNAIEYMKLDANPKNIIMEANVMVTSNMLEFSEARGIMYDATNNKIGFILDTTRVVGNSLLTLDYLNQVRIPKDNAHFHVGIGDDLTIYHDGVNSYVTNSTGTFNFQNLATTSNLLLSTASLGISTSAAGDIALTGGVGGYQTVGSSAAGAGGNILLQGGAGGEHDDTGVGGAGGNITINAGAGGFSGSEDGAGGNIQLTPGSGSADGKVIIGNGAASIDYQIKLDGETNDAYLTWMEDENYLKIPRLYDLNVWGDTNFVGNGTPFFDGNFFIKSTTGATSGTVYNCGVNGVGAFTCYS